MSMKVPPVSGAKIILVTYYWLSAKTQFHYYLLDVYMIFVE